MINTNHKYVLIETSDYTDFLEEVNDFIQNGYTPHGSLSVLNTAKADDDEIHLLYIQALIKLN